LGIAERSNIHKVNIAISESISQACLDTAEYSNNYANRFFGYFLVSRQELERSGNHERQK
jgi:hypothetical protein